LEEETEREKKTTRPVSHTALPTARTSGLYGPVPPRQHNTSCPAAPLARAAEPGATSTTPSHHVSATPSPSRPQQFFFLALFAVLVLEAAAGVV